MDLGQELPKGVACVMRGALGDVVNIRALRSTGAEAPATMNTEGLGQLNCKLGGCLNPGVKPCQSTADPGLILFLTVYLVFSDS